MPNVDDLKQRQAARQLRKEQRELNVEKAHAQDANLSDLQQKNEKTAAETAVVEAARKQQDDQAIDHGLIPAAKRKPTRTEKTREEKVKHARQAEKDAQKVPAEVNVARELEKWDGTGSPPLHVLNAVAERADREIRDEGKEVATAAGKAAYEVYTGKLAGKRSRHARMRAQITAGEAAIAARKKTGDK